MGGKKPPRYQVICGALTCFQTYDLCVMSVYFMQFLVMFVRCLHVMYCKIHEQSTTRQNSHTTACLG